MKGWVLIGRSLAAAIVVVSCDMDLDRDMDEDEAKWSFECCGFRLFSRLWLFVAGSGAGLADLAERTATVP